ncbi:hypothetical protein Tco_0718508 [Tanacetum coccineum]
MLACKPCSTPIEVNPHNKKVVSKFGDDVPLTRSHLRLEFRMLRYLKREPGLGITFKESDTTDLRVFVDSDWAKCKVTRRSITRSFQIQELSFVDMKRFLKDYLCENLSKSSMSVRPQGSLRGEEQIPSKEINEICVLSVYVMESELPPHSVSNCTIEVDYHKLKGLWDEIDVIEAPYACTCKCTCENGKENGEREQRKSYCKKEGHHKEECYKLLGYPPGHPLHNKYQPPSQRASSVNKGQRSVNLMIGDTLPPMDTLLYSMKYSD